MQKGLASEDRSVEQYHKMDILFYNSLKRLKQQFTKSVAFHTIKFLMLIVFVPINYSIIDGPREGIVLAALIVALATSFLEAFPKMLLRHLTNRHQFWLKVCKEMGHSTSEIASDTSRFEEYCVSRTIYNQQNDVKIDSQGLTDSIKKMYENIMTAQLKEILQAANTSVAGLDRCSTFFGFCAFVVAIVALAVGEYNTAQMVILIIFVVLEGLSKIFIVLILLFIALLPLLCCGLCFFAICCSNGLEGGTYKLPEAVKATEADITEAEGTCTICYQDFKIGSDIIKLRCSPKHAFHPLCIEGWTKVKPNCPICRTPISEELNRSAPI